MSEQFIHAASEALRSSAYDSAEITRRLQALFAEPTRRAVAHAGQAPGTALRLESKERARKAVDQILQAIDYGSAMKNWADPQLLVLGRAGSALGQHGLLLMGYKTLVELLQVLEQPNSTYAKAVVAYLEHGDSDARSLLETALKDKNAYRLASACNAAPDATSERCYQLLAPLIGKDDIERIRWLADMIPPHLTTIAVKTIARNRGITLKVHDAGKPTRRSGLAAYRVRPLLQLAYAIDRDLLFDIVPIVAKNPSIEGSQIPWLLSFLPWDVDQELWNNEARFRASRLQGFVVTSGGKHGKGGSASAKLHKKIDKAEEDYNKKLAAQQTKLGVKPEAPRERSTSLNDDLFDFSGKNYRERVAELVAAGADPNYERDGWTPLEQSRAWDPEIIELLLRAGTSQTACRATLLRMAREDLLCGDEDGLWPTVSARILIEHAGAEPAALHAAAKWGHLEIVEALLDASVDPNALDEERRTATDLAKAGDHLATEALLRARGGKAAAEL